MLVSLVLFLVACQVTQDPEAPAAPTSTEADIEALEESESLGEQTKIRITLEGKIYLNGTEASFEEVKQELKRLQEVNGTVLYYREGGRRPPWAAESVSAAIMLEIGKADLPFPEWFEEPQQTDSDRVKRIDDAYLHYTEAVTEAEAEQMRRFFLSYGGFSDGEKHFVLDKIDGRFQYKIEIFKELQEDRAYLDLLRNLAHSLSVEAFEGQGVDIHICDENFATVKVVTSEEGSENN